MWQNLDNVNILRDGAVLVWDPYNERTQNTCLCDIPIHQLAITMKFRQPNKIVSPNLLSRYRDLVFTPSLEAITEAVKEHAEDPTNENLVIAVENALRLMAIKQAIFTMGAPRVVAGISSLTGTAHTVAMLEKLVSGTWVTLQVKDVMISKE